MSKTLRDLTKLLSENKQLKAEKTSLIKTNHQYAQQIQVLEKTVAHLQLQLSAAAELESPAALHQFQQEHGRLEVALKLKEEQLLHETSMKARFEKRYTEAQQKLEELTAQGPSELRKQLADVTFENETMRTHYIPKLHAELEQSTRDILELQAKVQFLQGRSSRESLTEQSKHSQSARQIVKPKEFVPSSQRKPATRQRPV